MNRTYCDSNFGRIWFRLLHDLYDIHRTVSPRGMGTREKLNVHLELTNPLHNILTCEARRPSYKFMVAEWLWIWFGHQDVESITQYNPQIAKFSDDGIIFKGAYGPKVFGTMTPLICQLRDDPDSRQAIIQIYIRPDGPTKDVPCTMTAQFLIRDGLLNLIVNMRSSDIWLGLPYDVFNFTMIQNIVAALLGLNIGTFFMNLGSSHLYVANFEVAQKVLIAQASDALRSPIFTCEPPAYLDTILRHPRVPADRVLVQPWKRYADVLCATSNEEAFLLLKTI